MIVGIVQCRVKSTRLTEKALSEVAGKKVIEHVIDQVKRATLLDKVVLATSSEKENDILEKIAELHGIECYRRQDEEDVLSRVYRCSEEYGADAIVRITGDCPLVDPYLIDLCIKIFRAGSYDYFGNPCYPDGLDVEVISFRALEEAWKWSFSEDREHVTSWIRKNDDRFNVGYLKDTKLSVDEEKDLRLIKEILTR